MSIFADVQDAVLEIQVEASSSDIEEDFTFNCLNCGEKFAEMHLLKKHEQIHLKDACEEVLSIQIPKPQVDSLNQMEIATGMTNNSLFLKYDHFQKLSHIIQSNTILCATAHVSSVITSGLEVGPCFGKWTLPEIEFFKCFEK